MRQLGPCAKLRWAVIHCPTLIPSILKDPYLSKKISKGILYEMLPRRTSIEIECMGTIDGIYRYDNAEEFIANKYHILSFSIDWGHSKADYDEHRISIRNYSQLIGLYNVLNSMKKHCILNTISGCHIHLDLSGILPPRDSIRETCYNEKVLIKGTYINYRIIVRGLEEFFTGKCLDGTIERIFGPYTGAVQSVKSCGSSKSFWINYNRYYNSLEFRTAPMTFEYTTIIKWYIAVNKLLNEFERYMITSKQDNPERILCDCTNGYYVYGV